MADCSYFRCIQERRFIKRELQKWYKDMVYIVGEFSLLSFNYKLASCSCSHRLSYDKMSDRHIAADRS